MDISMDETVFFQTLEQYQYNPAMIIAGEAEKRSMHLRQEL